MTLEEIAEADRIICNVLSRDTPPRQAIMHMLRWWLQGAQPITRTQFITTSYYSSGAHHYWLYQLIGREWIAVVEDAADRRRGIVTITDNGREYCEWLKAEFERFQQRERTNRMTRELRMLNLA